MNSRPWLDGGGVGAGARRRSADGHRKRGEFGLDVDELAVCQFAGADHFAQTFDDVGLRRDRIGADDFGPAEGDALRHGQRAFDLLKHGYVLVK